MFLIFSRKTYSSSSISSSLSSSASASSSTNNIVISPVSLSFRRHLFSAAAGTPTHKTKEHPLTPPNKKKPKRVYTTGFEHDPIYGPDAERKRLLDRGINLPKQGMRKSFDPHAAPSSQANTAQAPAEEQQRMDTRFFKKARDFREMQDGDPYKDLFGERRSFVRTKVGAWRAQFEQENEDVELPYERTGPVARSAPNWFVRWMIGIRENQGFDFVYLFIAFAASMTVVALWSSATVAPMGEEKDVRKMK